MILELKKRQDFFSLVKSILFCRSLWKSPIAEDALWVEIPLSDTKNPNKIVGEVLIV
jgi:hypothetical protein